MNCTTVAYSWTAKIRKASIMVKTPGTYSEIISNRHFVHSLPYECYASAASTLTNSIQPKETISAFIRSFLPTLRHVVQWQLQLLTWIFQRKPPEEDLGLCQGCQPGFSSVTVQSIRDIYCQARNRHTAAIVSLAAMSSWWWL
jgi:hypothetical protein